MADIGTGSGFKLIRYFGDLVGVAGEVARDGVAWRGRGMSCCNLYLTVQTNQFQQPVTIGMDLEPTLTWLRRQYPSRAWLESSLNRTFFPPQVDLVIASDVVEHIPMADDFMRLLRRFCARFYVVSTPDRGADTEKHGMEALSQAGPPRNPAHVREWTHNELAAYVHSHGFRVLDSRRNDGGKQNTMWLLLELGDVDRCRENLLATL